MIGVAGVAAHGQAEQLAAKVILETGANDLLSVEKILRADESDDGVDQKRIEGAGDSIGAGFERLLVAAVMGSGRQRAALARLEIHEIVAAASRAAATARRR